MQSTQNRANWLFTGFLILIITVVGVIQSVVEWKRDKSIQCFYILTDSYARPLERARELTDRFEKVRAGFIATKMAVLKIGDNGDDRSTYCAEAAVIADEFSAAVIEIKNSAAFVNHYRSLSDSDKAFAHYKNLGITAEKLLSLLQDEAETAQLRAAIAGVETALVPVEKQSAPLGVIGKIALVGKTIFSYTILSREYLKKYEDGLKENSVVAINLRPWIQFTWYTVFGNAGEKAIQGRDSWLFYKQDVQYLVRPDIGDRRSKVVDPEDAAIKDSPIDSIVAFRDELARYDIELVVMVVPTKPAVYPDYLTPSITTAQSCLFSRSTALIDSMRKHGVAAIDLYTVFAQERKKSIDATDPLYLKQDTHWRGRGVQVVAQTVADYVRSRPYAADLPKGDFVTDTLIVDRIGDVGAMTKLPDFKIRSLACTFGTESTPAYQVYKVTRDDSGVVTEKTIFRDDFQRAKIIVIGDSFSRIYQTDEPGSAGWIANLAANLRTPICSIVSDGGASTLVREKLARKKGVLKGKKLLIWEFVERDFRYGAEGWKEIRL